MELTATKYKQTEVGLIPEDWDVRILEDMASKIGSGITPRGGVTVYKDEGRPFVRSQNIGWGSLKLDDIKFITDEIHSTFPNTEIKLNDVFLNISGASIGRSSYATIPLIGGNVNQHVCIIRTDKNKLNYLFLNKVLLSSIGQKQIDSFQSGGNREGLNIGQIKTFQIPLPPTLTEQKVIARVLSDTDALIQALEKKIAKKKHIKKGVMQKLLTPKENWIESKVASVGQPYGGMSGKTKADFSNGNAHYVPFMNVMSNPIIDTGYLDSVNINKGESQNKIIKGDLLFNGSSETPEEVGFCSAVLEQIDNLYLNSFCFGFRIFNTKQYDSLFLAYYFRSTLGRNFFYSLAQGATRYNLSKTNFLKSKLTLPIYEDQVQIATLIRDIDCEIENLEQKLSKYELAKQGMMQQLLTGKIRLV